MEKKVSDFKWLLYYWAEWRRVLFFTFNLILTSTLTLLMADLLWRIDLDYMKILFLTLFFILMWQVSLGFIHALFGLFALPKKGKFDHITMTIDDNAENTPLASTAILIPIYNEDTKRVYDGIKTLYLSLKETEYSNFFDIFILSDSNDPNKYVMEETSWIELCHQLNAFGDIHYRRRENNFHKKAGNISNFCRSWGKNYRYMICLDADSIMSGASMVKLVRIMEKNPGTGICQTAPAIVRGETGFARMLQFASNFYGPLFQSGLNFWQQGKGNFWGHNAIIRIAPFMEHCALPRLPGKEPLGGKILSHDFVEAALMQKAGWAVWLAYDVGDSYEESPPNLIEYAKRDRRWCQGNLQHTWLLLSKGIPWVNKIHFFNGIMSYVGSLIWFVSLIMSTIIIFEIHKSDLSIIPVLSFAKFIKFSVTEEALFIFILTMVLLISPKLLSIIYNLVRFPGSNLKFGGTLKIIFSIICEIVLSTLIAPVLMLLNSKFVIFTLLGRGIGWNPQQRKAKDGISTSTAIRVHGFHTLLGIIWAIFAYLINIVFFWWLSPITFSLILSIPISIILSKNYIGIFFKKHGIFLTPSEVMPTDEIALLDALSQTNSFVTYSKYYDHKYFGILQAIVDPYINAIHTALLLERDSRSNLEYSTISEDLEEKILKDGPAILTKQEVKSILGNAGCLNKLHQQVWLKPSKELHLLWQHAISNIK